MFCFSSCCGGGILCVLGTVSCPTADGFVRAEVDETASRYSNDSVLHFRSSLLHQFNDQSDFVQHHVTKIPKGFPGHFTVAVVPGEPATTTDLFLQI